ncbi:hypothetical protein [Paraburkholderia sp. J76]|uniref:hypothetical protein n=1 Tax=Paraburkholderia sp. J76 TaxID=2805439 RepID=UPI002ABD3D1E|nr:hypothetical protein [Paraburkholderia sp. J76]
MELTGVVDLIYAAALGEGASWQDVGDQLMNLMGAQRATLWLKDEGGAPGNVLMRADSYDKKYAQYVEIDPYRAAALEVGVEETMHRRGDVRLGHEIIPDASYVKSEFYADFGRISSRRYMIGGLICTTGVIPLGLHRDAAARPFDEADKRTLSLLLPHLQRALQMGARLAPVGSGFAAAALDSVPIGVIVVDHEMRVLYCNAEGTALVGNPRSGLSIVRDRRGSSANSSRLFAHHPADHAQLCRLVGAASRGGAGGGMQVRAHSSVLAADAATLSALVCPALRHLSSSARANMGTSVMHGAATVLARNLLRSSSLPARLLVELFGLTRAEAEVAVALAGGVTAEDVARKRHVSLETVRSQIRTILRKTGASGLRDFERIIALGSTMHAMSAARPVSGDG